MSLRFWFLGCMSIVILLMVAFLVFFQRLSKNTLKVMLCSMLGGLIAALMLVLKMQSS